MSSEAGGTLSDPTLSDPADPRAGTALGDRLHAMVAQLGAAPVRSSRDADAERAFERLFSPEFRNRLDAKLQFRPLSREVMELIVDKLIAELAAQLEPKAVRVELTPAARRLLAERGYDPAFGARPLARVLDETVKRPLTQELLFGALQHGGVATVDAAAPAASGEGPEISVCCQPASPDEV